MKDYWKLFVAIVGCELVGLVSTPFTLLSIETWYSTLQKPALTPPNWIFGPVWTTLYLLMGVSAFIVWNTGLKKKGARKALHVFLLQLGLNFLWSLAFFGLQSPLLGLIVIVLLIAAIFVTIVKFYAISKSAAYLLIPYLAWVVFASTLNFNILILN